jgi:hypothetical protein
MRLGLGREIGMLRECPDGYANDPALVIDQPPEHKWLRAENSIDTHEHEDVPMRVRVIANDLPRRELQRQGRSIVERARQS